MGGTSQSGASWQKLFCASSAQWQHKMQLSAFCLVFSITTGSFLFCAHNGCSQSIQLKIIIIKCVVIIKEHIIEHINHN